jgi:O-antigen/teichoic acid export membrane protein
MSTASLRVRFDAPARLGRLPVIGALLAARDAQLLLSAAGVFAIRIAGAALAYALAIMLVHWLGVREFGIYAHLYAATGLLALVLPLGFNAAVLRFIPDYLHRGRRARMAGLIVVSRRVVASAALAASLAMACGVLVFRNAIPGDYWLPLLLAIACLPLLACMDLYESFARGFGWTALAYVPPYVVQPLVVVLFVGAVVASGVRATAAIAMAGLIVATGAAFGFLLVVFRGRARAHTSVTPWRSHARVWTLAALPLMVVEAARAMMEQTDILMLAALAGPEEVAAYFAAARTAGLLGFVFFAVAALAVPRYSELYGSGRMRELNGVVRTTLHLGFWSTLFGLAVLGVAGPFILSVFDPSFARVWPAMMVLGLGFLVRAAAGPVEFLLAAAGDQGAAARIYMLGAGVNVALNLVFIPTFGVLGAAGATATSVMLVTALLVARVWRTLEIVSFLIPPMAIPVRLRRSKESALP